MSQDFEKEANRPAKGIVGEYVDFLKHNKKWWLAPLIITLLLVGILVLLGATGAAPFIYTLF